MPRILSLLLLVLTSVSGIPVPFEPFTNTRNQDLNPHQQRNHTNDGILRPGSSQYDLLIQEQRERSNGGGGGNLTFNNGTSGNQSLIFRPFLSSNYSCDPSNPQLCVHSQRDKQLRLDNIRNYVLYTLGLGKAPGSAMKTPSSSSNGIQQSVANETPFSGEIKTFYASCDIPPQVDADVWTNSNNFHLYFKFPADFTNNTNTSPTSSTPTGRRNNKRPFSTISAKLKLYKIGQTPLFETLESNEPCNETTLDNSALTGSSIIIRKFNTNEENTAVEDRIRVSVYWYKAPVTKIHYKKKLLDTKMMSVKESKWVEFDIKNAAVPWLDNNDNNFGILVQVENEDNDLLDARKYFPNVNCPDPDNSSNSTIYSSPQLTPPQLEICILNTPQIQRQEIVTEAPFPFMGESFSILSRVAKAHAAKSQQSETEELDSQWQNDFQGSFQSTSTSTTPKPRNHKHRHNHGSRKNKKENTEAGTSQLNFELDEDHPLRRILATVATNVHANNRKNSHSNSRQPSLTFPLVTSTESEDEDGDIIIQKIYIRPTASPSSSQQVR